MSYFTGSVPLYMLCGSDLFFDELAIRWTATDLYINPGDYKKQDNSSAIVAAWFEANINDASGGANYISLGPGTLELIDETDTVRATITTDGVTSSQAKRYRVAADIDTTTAHTYRLRNGGEALTYNLTCQDAKIILDVEDAYRVKLMVGLLQTGDQSTSSPFNYDTEETVNRAVWCAEYSSTSYSLTNVGGSTTYWIGKFLKDASQFATIENWEFEGVASQYLFLGDSGDGGEASSNGYMALFNATDNTQVTGTELTFPPGTSRQSITFANNATNFDDLDEFEPRYKVQNDSESLGVARVTVYVQLTAATKAQYIAGVVLNGLSIPFGSPYLNTNTGRYYHDASKFPEDALFYYELTGKQRGNDVPTAIINDAGTADNGDQSAVGTPSAASSISGSWSNIDNAGDDGSEGGPLTSTSALFSSSTSSAVAQLQQTDFTFNPSIPGAATITHVNYFLRLVLDGQAASIGVKVNSQAFHTVTVQESLESGPDFITSVVMYDVTTDTTWTVSDFTSPTVDVKCTHPANTTLTDFWINGGSLYIGWGDPVAESELSFAGSSRVRTRSGALPLTDGNRYNAVSPGGAVSTNKIDHALGVILAELEVEPDVASPQTLELPTLVNVPVLYPPALGQVVTPPPDTTEPEVFPPSVALELKSVEILRGSILEGDWLRRDLFGANAAVTTPQIFTLEVADKLKLSMLPPPNAVRGLDYLYVPQPTVLTTPTDSTTQEIDLPADFIPFLKFGVLADLFLKSGEAHDPARGKVCQDMYELGLEIARVYVAGINS